MDTDIVVNPYNDPLSKGRKGIFVKTAWSDEYRGYIRKHAVKALYFNSAKGWDQSNFDFLRDLDGIEEIDILCPKLENFKAIEGVRSLQQLSVTGVVTDAVDFTVFSELQRCYLYWWRGAESILQSSSLRQAYFDKLRLKDYGLLCKLKAARSLTIGNSPMPSLAWMEDFEGELVEFSLLNCKKLEDFAAITSQKGLRKLVISGSPELYELDFLASFPELEVLDLSDSGPLKSLAPLENIKSLKVFSFAGTRTVVEDKDLSVLTKLPKLSMLMFGPRRGYTHKLVKQWSWQNFDHPDKLLDPV
ncbi:leucine-rich repeat domain-containing protein [Microbulbifer discodermiae]|uniref:leucine-rich repeat domain-containing protein n=1 Tax=Microbulbifer sp. 2201CG32-9 TaxID=3232309 RepID=UPI00345B8438